MRGILGPERETLPKKESTHRHIADVRRKRSKNQRLANRLKTTPDHAGRAAGCWFRLETGGADAIEIFTMTARAKVFQTWSEPTSRTASQKYGSNVPVE
jgi:hypothetical protein